MLSVIAVPKALPNAELEQLSDILSEMLGDSVAGILEVEDISPAGSTCFTITARLFDATSLPNKWPLITIAITARGVGTSAILIARYMRYQLDRRHQMQAKTDL